MSGVTLSELTLGRAPGFTLKNITAVFEPGKLVGIIGPNGAGKSTLAKAMVGIGPALGGQILIDGKELRHFDLRKKAQYVGYLPQASRFAWRMTVQEAVTLGRFVQKHHAGELDDALKACGLAELRERDVLSLSGGEQMRVHLCRLFYGKHELLVADEPCASLDVAHQHKVMKLLRDHSAEHTTVVVIHDLALAQRYCDRLLLLHEGALVCDGSVNAVLESKHCAEAFGIDFKTYESSQQSDGPATLIIPQPRHDIS